MDGVRFGHVNLVAADWRRLVKFYSDVFGCVATGTERDLHGELLERGTKLPGAHLRGMHLRLPGHGESGPTLEIFSYEQNASNAAPATPNRVGFGHIAFVVPEVSGAIRSVLAAGGSQYGEAVTTAANGRKVTWVYMRDPEGNLVELQAWSD
ncbi:MAG: VOC family protein [Candidatus Didemnitutus sp.]|nr:VOC family protein [Candidatus Didemnitutus sp.]